MLSGIFTSLVIFSAISCLLIFFASVAFIDKIEEETILLGSIFIFVSLIADGFRRVLYLLNNPFYALLLNLSIFIGRVAPFIFIDFSSLKAFLTLLILSSLIPTLFFIFRTKFTLSLSRKLSTEYFFYSKWNLYAAFPVIILVHVPMMLASILISPMAMSILVTLRSVTTFTNVFVGLFDTVIPILYSAGLKIKIEFIIFIFYFLTSLIIFKYGDFLLDFLFGPRFSEFWFDFLLLWILSSLNIFMRIQLVKLRDELETKMEFLSYSIGAILMTLCFLVFSINSSTELIIVMLISYLSVLVSLYGGKKIGG